MTTSPGWYDDGHGATRWWDGERWTEHVSSGPGPEAPATTTLTAGPAPGSEPPEPSRRSRMWILWVVIGVVAIGLLTALALAVLPSMLGAQESAGSPAVDGAQQKKAAATLKRYDEAWKSADCVAYLDATTEGFRNRFGLGDCSAFETEAETLDAASDDYTIVINGVRQEGEKLIVSTTETFTALMDDSGAPLDKPTKDSVDWEYVLVAQGSGWVIDGMR